MEQATSAIPQMVSEKQAARILAVSIAALRRWRSEGRGPQFTRLERCIRYDMRAIERFLAENSSPNRKITDSLSEAGTEVCDGRTALHS
jgi:hypothetical protein